MLRFLNTGVGVLVPTLLPIIQLGLLYRFWTNQDEDTIDRKKCKCYCWDTLFKGTYEKYPAGYHNIYFNITTNTAKIWAITVAAIILTYETCRHVTSLIMRGRARLDMLLLFLSAIYPHYYSWWSMFNYLNDDFYKQWWHQLIFSGTELISSVLVVLCMDRDRNENSRFYLAISMIAGFHILASGIDQFVKNVLFGSGKNFQLTRDLGFMSGDLLNLLIPLRSIFLLQKANHSSIIKQEGTQRALLKDFLIGSCIVITLLTILHFL